MSVLDLYPAGQRIDFGTHHFSTEDIIAFARIYDPQPFHIDAEAARTSLFGGLCASGWQTAGIWMRKNCDYRDAQAARLRARGEEAPFFGPSPGVKNLRWHKPVFAGETIRFGMEILNARPLHSKPGWGIIESRSFAENEQGDTVMTFESAVLVKI